MRRCLHLARSAALCVVAGLVVGNLAVVLLSMVAARIVDQPPLPADVEGIGKLRVVDAQVWRGAAPSSDVYRALARAGVTTVVDLRAEPEAAAKHADAIEAGLDVVHLPIRDGQLPSPAQIERFERVVAEADGTVFLHCGAGVGRTGAIAAAHLVRTGEASASTALARNLAVGPPSLEQIAFVASLDGGYADRPPVALVAISRVLDAPRRIWSSLR